ncbi:20112_t:CDS:2, partial [Racocetra fulgida]
MVNNNSIVKGTNLIIEFVLNKDLSPKDYENIQSVSPDNNEKYEYGRPSSQESGPTKIQHVQDQIDNTKSEIHKSLFDMANRGKKLGDLEEQTGLGFLTHALLNNTNAKRIIALDNDKDCVENLARLAEESSGRLEVIQAENNIVSKFASNKLEAICTWLQKEKLADMQIYPWEEGAGAESLIKNLSFDSQVLVKDTTVEQFIELAQIFEQWPFRPVNLH